MSTLFNQDGRFVRELHEFLEKSREAYMSCSDDGEVATAQTRYEVTMLAIASTLKWFTNTAHYGQLPEPFDTLGWELHDAVCEYGDERLREKGYICEQGRMPYKPV